VLRLQLSSLCVFPSLTISGCRVAAETTMDKPVRVRLDLDWQKIASSAELDVVAWSKTEVLREVIWAIAKGTQNFFDSMFLKKLGE
jgi:hypothetical protein